MANPITKILITAVDRTKAAFASAKGGLTSLGTAATSLKATLGTIFAGFAVAGMLGALKQAIDRIDAVGEAAERVGTSTENFSALGYAAQMSASNAEELEAGLARLSKSLADARTVAGPAADAFAALQIDPAQFDDPADALLALADRFAAMPDGVNKAALAMDLFGKAGTKLIPMLNQGRAGIEALKQEAADLGIVIGSESARAAGEFNDNMDKIRAAASGLGVSVANEILPGLNQVTGAMAEAAKQGGVLEALWVGLGGLGAALFTDDLLTNAQQLEKTQRRLNDALAAGFAREHDLVRELETKVVVLKNAVAAEQKAAAEQEKIDAARTRSIEDRKTQNKALKEATEEQIDDAQRLKEALQTAFSASIKAEADYLRQAKKLRAEANAPAEIDDSVEAQASARLDATIAAMKLQREASSASLEDTQAQADAVRALAERLTDAAAKRELLNQANAAEARAFEKAAAEEAERARQQAAAIKAAEEQAAGLGTRLEAIGKPTTVEIQPGAQVAQVKQDLTEIKHLIEFIQNTPVAVNVSAGGTGALKDSVKTAALQYGRR